MSDKAALRDHYRKIRDDIAAAAKKSAARKIHAQLLQILEYIGAKSVAIYVSKGSEVETQTLIAVLARKKIQILAPKVVQNNLSYIPIQSLKDCAPGTFGVMEPKGNNSADIKKIDVILVPGLVFDSHGYRLGYGKGFYDRLLSSIELFNTIGLCYDKTFIPSLPRDAHDAPVSWVITETRAHCITPEQK